MSWVAPLMKAARVAGMTDAGDGLIHLTLEMPPDVIESFTLPGQYQELAIEGFAARPYAIASGPGQGTHFEFLVRRGFPLADAIGKLQVGDSVSVSRALGPGFPMDVVRGRDLLLIATGTGAAPMRAVIQTVVQNRTDFGSVTFYFGGRHAKDFAFEREWERWEHQGVAVVRTVSEDFTGWEGLRGFVQQHFREARWQDAAAFVVGSNPMVQAVTAELVKRGMPRERVFLNL